jgi:hypothetical protein
MVTRTKVTSVLSLCSLKWLLVTLCLVFFSTSVFAQEVTFKVKKDTILETIDSSSLSPNKEIKFYFNDTITSGLLSKRYIKKNGLKLTANTYDIEIYGFELRCENRNGLYKNFVIHGVVIPKYVLKQLIKIPNGSTILVGAIREKKPELGYNKGILMTLRLTD